MNKKHVLIAGDSWGLGELLPSHISQTGSSRIVHGGLAQYLTEHGHQVWNISSGGLANLAITERVSNWMGKFHERNINLIIVFATEYTRDMAYDLPIDYSQLKLANDLAGIYLSKSYYRLKDISDQYKVPIYLVGGVADTMWLDNWNDTYSGVEIICQSMTQLVLNNSHLIKHPVYSWYGVNAEKTVKLLKQHLPQNEVESLIALIEQGFQRQSLVYENPEFFWPDGVHPNRKAHKKLFDFLQQQKLFD